MTVDSVPLSASLVNTDIGPLPAPTPYLKPNIIDLFSLTGKSAVITGGVRGIGAVVAEAYLQAGCDRVALMDYAPNPVLVEKLAAQFPNATVLYVQCDVRKADLVSTGIAAITAQFKIIDVFVANAGIAWTSGPMIDQETDDDWHNVVNIDLNGVYYCSKHIGRVFREQGFGSLIMTASMLAHIVNVPQLQAAYNAAKAGVLHLAKSLAIEWAPFARVNSVSPGYIGTELLDFVPQEMKHKWYSMIPQGRQGDPRELCGAYLYFASDASTYTTGSDLRVDGGYCAV